MKRPAVTAQRVVDWVISHKKREFVLPGWDDEQVALYIATKICEDEAFVALDKEGEIWGVLIASIDEEKRSIFADFILCDKTAALFVFLKLWHMRYNGYSLQAKRQHGRIRSYKQRHFAIYFRYIFHSDERQLAPATAA